MDVDGFRFDLDLDEVDLDLELGDDPPPPIEPPRDEPEREPRPERPVHVEPETGSWFLLSMGAFVASSLLGMMAIGLGGGGGEAAVWFVVGGLTIVYLGVFLVGATWFGWHQRA